MRCTGFKQMFRVPVVVWADEKARRQVAGGLIVGKGLVCESGGGSFCYAPPRSTRDWQR
jgi:hypothetical protein